MYCVMNVQKRKRQDICGIEKEAVRTANNYNNNVVPGMDMFNITLVNSNNWMQSINDEIKRAGAKTRSNSTVALDTVYSATREFFTSSKYDRTDYFEDCLKFHEERFGHVVSAIIHYDETTPHLHVLSVPLTKDNRLSARDLLGGRKSMSDMQDAFFEQVGRKYNLERGIQLDGEKKRKHISAQEYELRKTKSELEKAASDLTKVKNARENVRERVQNLEIREKQIKTELSCLQHKQSDIEANLKSKRELLQQLTESEKKKRSKVNKMVKDIEQLQMILSDAQQRQFSEIRHNYYVNRYDDEFER